MENVLGECSEMTVFKLLNSTMGPWDIPACYVRKKLSFKRRVKRHLPAESSMGKTHSHIMKGLHKTSC